MKKQREGIMLAQPLEPKHLNLWPVPFYVQPKLDGMRMRVELSTPEVNMVSATGRRLNHILPHIRDDLNSKAELFHLRGIYELDGELYSPDLVFEDIVSICKRTKNLHPDHKQIQYHIFDHISTDPFHNRLIEYSQVLEPESPCVGVDTFLVSKIEDAFVLLEQFIEDGYEGVIFRHPLFPYERKRSRGLLKFKPCKEDTYIIKGTVEEVSIHGEPKGTLGALILSDI